MNMGEARVVVLQRHGGELGLRLMGSDSNEDAVYVLEVREGSAAAAAGLGRGDRIVQINREDVSQCTCARALQLIRDGGATVEMLVVGNGDI